MSLIIVDGFKVYDDLKGKPQDLIIESDQIDKGMEFFHKNKLRGIVIASVHGYNLNNVNFLKNYPFIKHISISNISNIEGLYVLKQLESLYISGDKLKIDFKYFPNLKYLVIDWSPSLLNIDFCWKLESLSLNRFKPADKNLMRLANISHLRSLTITQSPITSLKGLDDFRQLEKLEINYCSKLEEICCLEGNNETLTALIFDHCKAIKNHEYVHIFRKLKILAYNNCGSIPSIKFIREMPSLEDFRFVGTDIIDGDISPCLGLKYAGFFDKKHYSHTSEQINKGA